MPYEVTISGGAPWGLRLSGGAPSEEGIRVSRVTPGGKAAAANVKAGDYLLAVNMQNLEEASLLNVMELIKGSGDTVHLTLLSDEEYQILKAEVEAAQQAEANAIAAQQAEAAAAQQATAPEPESFNAYESELEPEYTLGGQQEEAEIVAQAQIEQESSQNRNVAIPNPNFVDPGFETENEYNKTHEMTRDEFKALPHIVQKAVRPPKQVPDYGKNVHWMHNRLKLIVNLPGGETRKDAGTKLKTAALAYPNKAVEISGPVRGNIRHAQYNTPCCMYSDAQIANTLISQAAAVGADVPDATAFGNDNIQVDTSTPVYKMNKERDAKRKVTQSKSFQLLDTLLKYPYLEDNLAQNQAMAQQINANQ
jgi:hypothetical protein